VCVILHSYFPALSHPWLRPFELSIYHIKRIYHRTPKLRMLESESLYAKRAGIETISFKTLKSKESMKIIASLNLDLLVVGGGWHEKIPPDILSLPNHGTINVHPSFLPEFRGTSITRWQIYEGATQSGVSIHYMDEDFDTGNVIAQKRVPIFPNEPPQILFQRLAEASAPLLEKVLSSFSTNRRICSDSTDHINSAFDRYYKKWQWQGIENLINLDEPYFKTHNKILAASQESFEYPGPVLVLNEKNFIIRQTELAYRKLKNDYLSEQENIAWLENDYIRLERANEPMALLIKRIQPYHTCFSIRRSARPIHWFSNGQHVEISSL
jgi:methionyl-tRNA formyltransferase